MTEEQFAFHVEVEQKNEEKSLTFSEKSFEETIEVQVVKRFQNGKDLFREKLQRTVQHSC